MVEFTMTWLSERGNVCTDTGRATIEEIHQWQKAIEEAVATNDEVTRITVPTDNDGEWSGGQVRAILVRNITPLAQRPASW